MRVIPLTKGHWAIVDDEDWYDLSRTSWYAMKTEGGIYAARRVSDGESRSHVELMHRYLMGNPEGRQVDHRDHNTLNNTRGNLRVASSRQNQGNSRKLKAKTSRFKGVHWNSQSNRWQAEIWLGPKKKLYLGRYADEHDAARAYDSAAHEHFGTFAHLNFSEQSRAI